MNRRESVLALLALCAAPPAAQAQGAAIPRIGVLTIGQTTNAIRDGFRLGLRDRGYVEGQNIIVEWRTIDESAGQAERAREYALELIRMKVDVIVATPTPAVRAAKDATNTIPIVMAPAGDPLATGLISSLARPGGNVTGIANIAAELGGKLLQLIVELRPAITRVAVLVDASNPFSRAFREQIQAGAATVGVQVLPVVVRSPEDLDAAFKTMAKERVGGVVVQPLIATKRVADLANQNRILSITTGIANAFPELGGLMSYGANPADNYRHAAVFVDKILKGAKPADLPVEQPTQFELVINRKTAKVLGIDIPHSMLLRADRVIE